MMVGRLTSLLLLCLVLSAPARAWGDYAHRLTGRIAMANLTPHARIAVRRILARSAAVDTPACPLATLEDASVWPDCVRGGTGAQGDRFAFASTWHYQNIDVCAPFDPDAKCADGNCVTAQIPRQLAILADRQASPAARAQALAFAVHFVGDMHMPLHIGDKRDRGGNDLAAAYGAKAPARMNLHRIWDSELAERALTEPPAIVAQPASAAARRAAVGGSVPAWARESWELSRTLAYPALKAFPDTCAAPSTNRAVVDAAYITAATPALRRQVERAGLRLAALLNAALAR